MFIPESRVIHQNMIYFHIDLGIVVILQKSDQLFIFKN